MIKKLSTLFQPYSYEVAICCIVKDEARYLPEWLEHHLKIGISQFFIYDNDSKIPVMSTLSTYVENGKVTVIPFNGKAVQMLAYRHCLINYGYLCKWIAFIDADEFIVPKTLTGNLPRFLSAYKKYGGLGINWLVFGSSGHLERPEGPLTQCYTKRALKSHIINNHIKTIVQPKYVKLRRPPHDPHHFKFKLGKYCVNENFECLKGPRMPHTSNKIQLNHYFLRSLEDFKEKQARGRADTGTWRAMEEFYELDKEANLIVDDNILELNMLLGNNI